LLKGIWVHALQVKAHVIPLIILPDLGSSLLVTLLCLLATLLCHLW
jgi:hypothetical protein